jgi:hypothetical protein
MERAEEILKDRSRRDRGELVSIAEEDQLSLRTQRTEQTLHKIDINHRTLIDDHNLR